MHKLFSLKHPTTLVAPYCKEKFHRCALVAQCLCRENHTYYAPLQDIKTLDKYDSKKVVEGRCKWWKEKGLFAPSGAEDRNTFSLLLPPPNVTGTLHLGHALTATIQDVLVKWHRMCGDNVLWIPGTDHAGIATQVIVEKYLERMNMSRHELGRKPFIKECTTWQKKHSGAIDLQLKELGCSLHWPKYYFTMDEERNFAVQEAFIQLFNSGMIYRKKKPVNWCCHLESSISDIEVEKRSLDGKTKLVLPGYNNPVEFGNLFMFAYKICDTDDEVVVATTRPETMFADVAVAVHPSDKRYSRLKGEYLWHPYRQEKIPIIFDESVDPEFGTGAVKITPGHSFVDYDIGERHNLKLLSCISEKGIMSELCGQFYGQKRFVGRELLLDDLAERNLLRGQESHTVELPLCSRSGDVLEVLLKPQWFIKMEKMAKQALEAVETGELQLEPSRFNDDWRRWLDKCRDWNISRQLWWGHRVPAFRLESDSSDTATWVAAQDEAEAKMLLPKSDEDEVYQDEDVLDTWFSSSILPFSSLGWPKKTVELQKFYPLSMMVSGHDILFFWIARMVMMGKELTGVLPFKKVLLHSIMCDSRGKKMSKSLGNVITPENVIEGITLKHLQDQIENAVEQCSVSIADGKLAKKVHTQDFPNGIPKCGVDALRMALCAKDVRNMYMSFRLPDYETNYFFCNKIWQAFRFYELSLGRDIEPAQRPVLEKLNLSPIDHWILSCLAKVVTDVDKNFKITRIDSCFQSLQYFLRSQLCDVYIESCKPRFADGDDEKLAALTTLSTCLETFLILLTPFAPYLTEALYGRFLWKKETHESILNAPYPQPEEWKIWLNPSLEEEVQVVVNIATAIKEIKQRSGVPFKDECHVTVETVSSTLEQYVPQMNKLIRRLTYCQITKLILVAELKVDKLSATDALIGDDVLVRVRILDGHIQKGSHERQVKVAARLRRKRKILANIEEIEKRLEIGEKQGKVFSETHHLRKKLSEWTKDLVEINAQLETMIADLRNRNEPIPSIEPENEERKEADIVPKKEGKGQTENARLKKKMKNAAPS